MKGTRTLRSTLYPYLPVLRFAAVLLLIVALARAFGTRPPLLLADEPTGNLDSATGASILDALVRLRNESGTTLVLVTHDPAVAALAGRRLHLRDGRIERDETVS